MTDPLRQRARWSAGSTESASDLAATPGARPALLPHPSVVAFARVLGATVLVALLYAYVVGAVPVARLPFAGSFDVFAGNLGPQLRLFWTVLAVQPIAVLFLATDV